MLAHVTADMPTKVEQLHVAHILFAKREDADAALKRLQAGEDFAATAKETSQDEATKDNGGDLGWIPKGVMAPEFEAAAFQLQPGQVSPVVQTQLGFHLIKVLERDPSREPVSRFAAKSKAGHLPRVARHTTQQSQDRKTNQSVRRKPTANCKSLFARLVVLRRHDMEFF